MTLVDSIIAANDGISKAQAKEAVRLVQSGLENGLKKDGDEVSLLGYFKAQVKFVPGGKEVRNPAGGTVITKDKNRVVFKVGQKLKDAVNK